MILKRIGVMLGLMILLAGAALGWFLVTNQPYEPTARALQLLNDTSSYQVLADRGGTIFYPEGTLRTTGVIFYPGGNVDHRSYSYWGTILAEEGYLTALVRMPLNLAVLAPNRADRIMERTPEVEQWVLIGHSLGGAMAGRYLQKQPESIRGLVLLGSYVDRDLQESSLKVLSLTGTRDTIVNRENLMQGRAYLPSDSRIRELDGGNHAFFGDYGTQEGDGESTVSFAEQKNWASKEVLNFLGQFE